MPVNGIGAGSDPAHSAVLDQRRQAIAAQKQAAGVQPSDMQPGTLPTDYIWDNTANAWVFNPHARPGQSFIRTPAQSKNGQLGWQPESNVNDPTGLFNGWTPAQLKALALFAGGAVAPAAIGALTGGGAAAGGAGAAAGSGAGDAAAGLLPSTSYAGAAALPAAAGAGSLAGGGAAGLGAAGGAGLLGSTSLAGSAPTVAAGAGNMTGGVLAGSGATSTPSWLTQIQNYGKTAGTVANVIGNAQTGANNARIAQGGLNNSANNSLVNLYQAQNNAQNQQAQTDLERQQFATKNRSDVMRQALVGSLLGSGSYQPTHVSPTSSSGGILNSLNANPTALQALKTFGQQGSTAQNTPLTFSGGQSVPVPTLAQNPQIDVNGTGSKISQALSIIGAIMAGK